jgi:hypothetical protein
MQHYIKTLPSAYNVDDRCGLKVDALREWAACSPDGVATLAGTYARGQNGTLSWRREGGRRGERILVEIKCPFSRQEGFGDDGHFYLKRQRDGTFSLNRDHPRGREYYWQMQYSQSILNALEGHLFVYSPVEHATVVVPRQSEDQERRMWDVLDEFHREYLRPRIDRDTYMEMMSIFEEKGPLEPSSDEEDEDDANEGRGDECDDDHVPDDGVLKE